MKKIIVVGFGNMGCRHVQSLLNADEKYQITVVEPSIDNIQNNCDRIGCKVEDLIWLNDLNNLSDSYDLAVVATSSAPRFTIVKCLLELGVKLFLLEKVVFQSNQQFKEIIELVEANGAKAYCNFVNRYSAIYNDIKAVQKAQNSSIKMFVFGGLWGMGCNSIHYIDVIEYILDSRLMLKDAVVEVVEQPNKRGDSYKEFSGVISFEDNKGNALTVVSDADFKGGVVITVVMPDSTYILCEETWQVINTQNHSISRKGFSVPPSSQITKQIVIEIFENTCRLTQLQETQLSHAQLFKAFNTKLLNHHSDDLICPIT